MSRQCALTEGVHLFVRRSILQDGLARIRPRSVAAVFLFLVAAPLWAATGGSISGTISDPSGAVVVGANLSLVNTALQTTYQATSDRLGFYSFPNLPVGHYDLTISASGFGTQRKVDLVVDTDSALRVDT